MSNLNDIVAADLINEFATSMKIKSGMKAGVLADTAYGKVKPIPACIPAGFIFR